MNQRELADDLFNLARGVVEREGITLLDVEIVPSPRRLVRFVIDAEGGATIDDCVRMNPILSDLLDEWDRMPGSYTLEVSSPGLDRQLRRREEYDHFRGRFLQVHADLDGRGARSYRGVLDGLDREEVLLLAEKETLRIPLDRIAKARLCYEDRKSPGTGRKK